MVVLKESIRNNRNLLSGHVKISSFVFFFVSNTPDCTTLQSYPGEFSPNKAKMIEIGRERAGEQEIQETGCRSQLYHFKSGTAFKRV